ncbi:MAG: zf-HC2 domain-containing protein [Gemmatimonadota bacterium]
MSEVICRTFLERYSDLVDDMLAPAEVVAMRRHLAECQRCRRYDRVVRRGVQVLRASAPAPSPDFRGRLRRRLARERALAPRAAASYPPYVDGWSA